VLAFVFGRRETPRETSFGVGERGVLKGCAAEVEVAGLVPVASRVIGVVVKERKRVEVRRGIGFNEALRRQERQIMMAVG
jgi:hypothetical protein